MIENMGDAYEAIEELLWLVQSQVGTDKAKQLLDTKFYPMARGEKPKDKAMMQVEKAMGVKKIRRTYGEKWATNTFLKGS